MKYVDVPQEILAAEIRSGHVSLSSEGIKHVGGALGALAASRAAAGLKQAAEVPGSSLGLKFPPGCCRCARTGVRARSIPTTSIVSRGVEYTFSFQVPHCSDCAATANRKRPGFLGRVASFLVVGFVVFLAIAIYGFATNNMGIAAASFILGPLTGLALPYFWSKLGAPRPGQQSRYQAVYVSAIHVASSRELLGFTLAFENDGYAERFAALNAEQGASMAQDRG